MVNMNSFTNEKLDSLKPAIKKAFDHYFERSQEYRNFFCGNNLAEVLKNVQNENYNYSRDVNELASLRLSTNTMLTSVNFGFVNQKK